MQEPQPQYEDKQADDYSERFYRSHIFGPNRRDDSSSCSVLRSYPMDLIGHLAARYKWETVQGDYDNRLSELMLLQPTYIQNGIESHSLNQPIASLAVGSSSRTNHFQSIRRHARITH